MYRPHILLVKATEGIFNGLLRIGSLERGECLKVFSLRQTWSLSPKRVRNMVKLIGPGASPIMASRYSSLGS